MCGIAGWIDYSRSLKQEGPIMDRMMAELAKRGPDESGKWFAEHAVFGHRRLAVVDIEGGKQPMTIESDRGTFTICYNGELYNTEELRKDLLVKGYSFKGHSDTEVLLTSYIEWKERAVDLANGIFAFAVWHHEKEELFLARDRLGVKPLFYKETERGLLFASELKAVLKHPSVKAEVDREGLAELFGLGPSHSPGTGVLKGIRELRPAHAMKLSREGMKIWRYWDVKSAEHQDSLEETAEKVRYLVKDAVIRQLVSDVPLATFLSGGLDSSIITAIAADHHKDIGLGSLHTYSIDYEDNHLHYKGNAFQPSDDGPFIALVSEKNDTVHHRCIITQEELSAGLREAVSARGLPGMADIDSSLLWFCKEVKKDFTVSLSGECADEIFGGYPWFHVESAVDGTFPWIRSMKERVSLLKPQWRDVLNIEEYVKGKYEETVRETPLLEGESGLEARRKQMFYTNMHWFMTTLLERKDRMSMEASLEVRVPFADHRLVEYVWNIPWEMKMVGGREKGILRKAMEGLLPDEVLYRKKSPYPKTHHPVYCDKVTAVLSEIVNNKSSMLNEFFKKEQLQDLLKSKGASFQIPWFGQLMSGPQLLAHLIQIHYWFEDFGVQITDK